jgi:hypothetical protein
MEVGASVSKSPKQLAGIGMLQKGPGFTSGRITAHPETIHPVDATKSNSRITHPEVEGLPESAFRTPVCSTASAHLTESGVSFHYRPVVDGAGPFPETQFHSRYRKERRLLQQPLQVLSRQAPGGDAAYAASSSSGGSHG